MYALSLVVPCYNEARRFPRDAFLAFLRQNTSVSLILVNDGSQDQTSAMLKELRQQMPDRVEVIDRQENRGKAETVREGILFALQQPVPADIVGFWDADLATPLEAVFDMVPVLESRPEIQMVFGARVKLLGRRIQRRAIRHYLGRIFATTVSVLLQLPIYDSQCGAKLFRYRPDLEQIFNDPFISRWVFDVEILARWIRLNGFDQKRVEQTIYEYPLKQWEDIEGSKVKPYDFLVAFGDVVRIWGRYLRH